MTAPRNRRAAIVSLLLIAVAFYAAFVRTLPLSTAFVLRGQFTSANQLKAGNPVRIGGLPVGVVTAVAPGPDATSIVTMHLDGHTGLHADASLAIKPRLLFEGNFYVALDPGTPEAAPLRSGSTIPLSRTAAPVQLDQLLDVLDTPARTALQQSFEAIASGLGSGTVAGAGQLAGTGTTTPGLSGLRRAARELTAALPPVAELAQAFKGVAPDDLGHAIASSSTFTGELAVDPSALADLVSSSDRVLASLATGRVALAQDLVALDRLTHVAPSSLSAIDGVLPTLTSFARGLDPVLATGAPAFTETARLFGALRSLAQPALLPALVDALGPVAADGPALVSELRPMFGLLTRVNDCAAHNIVPALDTVLADGANSTGYPAWKDLLHLGAALSGASASFDANGVALRIGLAEGDQDMSGLLPGFGSFSGGYQGEGVRPHWLGYGVVPPFRPDARCAAQAVPKANG